MTEPTPAEQMPLPKVKIEAGGKIQAIVPRDIEEAFRMAEAIFLSGMYPDSYAADANGKSGRQMGPVDRRATVSRIMIGIQKAMEVGLAPITGLSNIYIVNNRPTLFGDGIPALLYGSGKVEYIKEWTTGTWGNDDYTAHCEIKRKDISAANHSEFSYADAKKAGLLGKTGPWQTHPKRQLQMRARGFAARDGAADILSGLGIYEEVMDIPEKKISIDTSSLDDAPAQPKQITVQNIDPVTEKFTIQTLSLEDEPEPIFVSENSPETLKKDAIPEEALAIQASEKSPDPPLLCDNCNGKGSVPFSETDPETGEILEGIEPCPNCKPLKGK